ncbi:MAG TPA: hypothetical protein VE571_08020 [Solirubrobacteraceae bacterium]|nr:hypothetical protein [Solirubrobacteraceae bacterium]
MVIHPRVRKTIGRIAALACVAVFVSSGAALGAQCPTQTTKPQFARWGDTAAYFLVPGGSFEGTPAQVGWTLSGATLTSGNEPFHINSAADSQSLLVDGGGSATSPALCVDSTMSSLRFFARQTGAGSDLQVQGIVQTPRGSFSYTVADLRGGARSAWTPVQVNVPTSRIPWGMSVAAAVRFVVPGSGSWQMDDVYLDPYRAG